MENGNLKKVLYVLTRPPHPLVDGTRERILSEVKALSKDCKLDILIVTEEKVSLASRNIIQNSISGQLTIIEIPKVCCYANALFGIFSTYPMQTYYYKSRKATRWLVENVSNYDTIHFHTIRLGRYLKLLKEISTPEKTKLLICFNDAISLNYKNALTKASGVWKFIYKIEQPKVKRMEIEMLETANGFSVVSEVDKLYLESIWAAKHPRLKSPQVLVIPNGIKDEIFEYNYIPQTNNLIFLGNAFYTPNKQGLEILCKNVLPKVNIESQETKLIIIGKGSKELFSNFKNVEPMGFMENPYDLMAKQALFINGATFGAGISSKVIMAMAMGMPTLSTASNAVAIDGIKEGENIWFIDLENTEETANKILQVLKDKQVRLSTGQKAKELAEKKYRFSKNYNELRRFILK